MKYIDKATFNKLGIKEQVKLFNSLLQEHNSIKEVCDYIGISYSTIRDRFSRYKYIFNKHSKAFEMINGDFEEAVRNASKNDFVFFDSPYAPLKEDSFEAYTKEGFSYDDHVRLADLFKTLSDKGVYCMLTNHNTELINYLYSDFNIEVVPVKRFINSDAKNRVGEEVIITNY